MHLDATPFLTFCFDFGWADFDDFDVDDDKNVDADLLDVHDNDDNVGTNVDGADDDVALSSLFSLVDSSFSFSF